MNTIFVTSMMITAVETMDVTEGSNVLFAGVKFFEMVVSSTLHLLLDLLGRVALVILCILLLNWYDLLPLEGSATSVTLVILMQGVRGSAVGLTLACIIIFFGGHLLTSQTLIFTVGLSFLYGEHWLRRLCEWLGTTQFLFNPADMFAIILNLAKNVPSM